MLSVGEKLQRARLDRGLDLATVASLTRINSKYLQAIESDDRASLPSAFFYKSFVHQYALLLALDTQELDAEIDPVLSAEAPPPLPGQEIREHRTLPRLKAGGVRALWQTAYAPYVVLVVALLGSSGIYSLWHKAQTGVVETSPPVQVQQAKTQPVLAAAVIPEPAKPAFKVLLELLAREETWLSVSSDGRRVFSGILGRNESKSVEGNEFAELKVGNAAGLEVRLNGKLVSPLGGRGQVLVVVFHPDNFKIVPQAPREGD